MEKKIVLSLFYMGVVTAVVGIIVTTVSYFGFFKREVEENLAHECHLLAQCYDSGDPISDLDRFTGEDFRITLIEKDGRVIFESAADAQDMANHLDRPEIKSAVKNGTGTDTRFSDTIGTQDYYYALRLDDGNILRVSIQADSIFALFERSLVIIIVIIIGIVIVSMIASVKLTDKLVSPLKKIPELLRTNKTASDTDIYPEIVPLVEEIRSVRSSQSEMRQEFTANVSHELKTPLTSISGYAQVIENGMAQGEDCIRFAAKIRSESARMLTLISDIIRLSELDSEEVESLNDDIDLTQTARECREQLEPLAERRGIRITLSGEAETIKGSRTEIHELVYNLVDNAIKYNRDNGNINITVSGKTLAVEDTGIGIPKESIPRIFERFYRADKSRSRAKGGTGLGLSIVRHIAERHGAEINVDSTVNVGTRITVIFR
ncbi:MAG: two-component sensor histidine kinase [Ruminococcus sp.]|nr:two-component sensor histidine kinase [Ruminococcus sp.]